MRISRTPCAAFTSAPANAFTRSATVFTTVIYAGSFEFLLVGLVTALAPLATIAVTAFPIRCCWPRSPCSPPGSWPAT